MNSPPADDPTMDIKDQSEGNPLYLIREEIAIMKKLNHPNVVSLIEVLDDPTEDSLYMVLEMCKKGVIMKVGIDERADPYDDETCRHFFRDLILGIEYRRCFRTQAENPTLLTGGCVGTKCMRKEWYIATSSPTTVS